MTPESFARWSPDGRRQPATFTVRLGAGDDAAACARLVAAIGAGDEEAWRQTLLRTARDGDQRALFVAETGTDGAGGDTASARR